MNLDEMLAASGITGGAAADGKNVKSGFVTLIGSCSPCSSVRYRIGTS